MAAKDGRNEPLQITFYHNGSVHMVSPKMFAELLKSDEGLFHQYILPLIPFDLVKKLYSDKNNVRPAEYAINYVAAALFVRLTGLTEEEFLEQLPWNLKYQYAIGIEQWSDGIPFGEKTFTNLRKRIECYNGSHNNEDIWDEITHSIDVAIAKKMQLFKGYNDTYRYGLRIDTLMISMQAARRPRLDIVYTTMKLAVEELIAKEIILPDKLKHFTDKDDHRKVIYFKGLQDEYMKEGLPVPNENETMSTTQRKEAITEHRLKKLISEVNDLRNLCVEADLAESDNFKLLERMISEQTDIRDGKLIPKDKRQIRSDSMQTPYEPEATYRYKAGAGYHGYSGFIVDLFNKESNGIIIDRRLDQNIHSDQAFMREFLENHDKNLDLNNDEKAFISADAGFFSVDLNNTCKKLNWDMYCAGVHGTVPSTIFTEFKYNDDRTTIIECPAGYRDFSITTPIEGTFKLRFKDKRCVTCINLNECGAILTGNTENRGSSYVTVSDAKISAALCVKMREGMAGPDVLEYLNKRNAIEGINSVLRRRYNIDNRHTAGIKFARYSFYGAITCYNIVKYFGFIRQTDA